MDLFGGGRDGGGRPSLTWMGPGGDSRATARAFAEAAIAWWHAYEARRRRRLIAYVVLLCLLATLVARLTQAPA